jgi:hypothetical protein
MSICAERSPVICRRHKFEFSGRKRSNSLEIDFDFGKTLRSKNENIKRPRAGGSILPPGRQRTLISWRVTQTDAAADSIPFNVSLNKSIPAALTRIRAEVANSNLTDKRRHSVRALFACWRAVEFKVDTFNGFRPFVGLFASYRRSFRVAFFHFRPKQRKSVFRTRADGALSSRTGALSFRANSGFRVAFPAIMSAQKVYLARGSFLLCSRRKTL